MTAAFGFRGSCFVLFVIFLLESVKGEKAKKRFLRRRKVWKANHWSNLCRDGSQARKEGSYETTTSYIVRYVSTPNVQQIRTYMPTGTILLHTFSKEKKKNAKVGNLRQIQSYLKIFYFFYVESKQYFYRRYVPVPMYLVCTLYVLYHRSTTHQSATSFGKKDTNDNDKSPIFFFHHLH